MNNPEGCEECRCYIPGVLGGNAVCNSESGACICKPFVVSQNCNECADGTYNLLEDSLFGCGGRCLFYLLSETGLILIF